MHKCLRLGYDAAMEFSIITKYFTGLGVLSPPEVTLAIGDDAALWQAPEGMLHVMSVDTAVAGVHFPAQASWYDIAYRAVGCAASDLAAMAATPAFATLAITLPEHSEPQLIALSRGLHDALTKAGLALIGGDTTTGQQLVLTLSVHGWAQSPVRRSGAKPGDYIFVSGVTGLAGAALPYILAGEQVPQAFWQAYWRPHGRFDLRSAVSRYATACIDISDGLLADLEHICRASNVAAQVDAGKLDISWRQHLDPDQARALALTAGDDYQLLCTAPEHYLEAMLASGFYCIGRCAAGEPGVKAMLAGKPLSFSQLGYQHQ